MKITIVCKSDGRGGAAVVSYRLMEALRLAGQDAAMLVCEKTTESPYVETASQVFVSKSVFMAERLGILAANGFDRKQLFDIDTGEWGLPLWKHPLIQRADVVILNWVNQGMLSLKGVEKICSLGKKVVWTMHDMWNCTGICHHAHNCKNYLANCGDCPLLKRPRPKDLSNKIWIRKSQLYQRSRICFVGVSSWITNVAKASSLLKHQQVVTIPNAFPTNRKFKEENSSSDDGFKRVVFGAARLDAPIKGLETLKAGLKLYNDRYPDMASKTKMIFYGALKDDDALSDMPVDYSYEGEIKGLDKIRRIYHGADAVISASDFETLPGTLIEGQFFGCFPIAFDRGGQRDIIEHGETGYLMEWHPDEGKRAAEIAEALRVVLADRTDATQKMLDSVRDKFSYEAVARKYLELISIL